MYEGITSFSAVLDRMEQFVTWAYSTFIDTYPGPGNILSPGDTGMNKAQPLPVRDPPSGRDECANREAQLRHVNRVSGTQSRG